MQDIQIIRTRLIQSFTTAAFAENIARGGCRTGRTSRTLCRRKNRTQLARKLSMIKNKELLQNLTKSCNNPVFCVNFYLISRKSASFILYNSSKNNYRLNLVSLLSCESFWEMGCGEKNLFSKRFFPHKTVLQQLFFQFDLIAERGSACRPSSALWAKLRSDCRCCKRF